jgi:hypothetical protein
MDGGDDSPASSSSGAGTAMTAEGAGEEETGAGADVGTEIVISARGSEEGSDILRGVSVCLSEQQQKRESKTL